MCRNLFIVDEFNAEPNDTIGVLYPRLSRSVESWFCVGRSRLGAEMPVERDEVKADWKDDGETLLFYAAVRGYMAAIKLE